MNIDRILKLSNNYQLLCEASLNSDMANRIMHSILPSVVPLSQVTSTDGMIDYNALNYAIAGKDKIIKYGLMACINEVEHCIYKSKIEDISSIKDVSALDDLSKIKILETLIALFNDDINWEPNYGGNAWAKIAKSILHLVQLNTSLYNNRSIKNRSIGDRNAEVSIMKQILVELNVFDGLCHNTGSIMPKLLDLESLENDNIDTDHHVTTFINGRLSNVKSFSSELKPYNVSYDRIELLNHAIKLIDEKIDSLKEREEKYHEEYDEGEIISDRIKELEHFKKECFDLLQIVKTYNTLSILRLKEDNQKTKECSLKLEALIKNFKTNSNKVLSNLKDYLNKQTAYKNKLDLNKKLLDAKELNNPVAVFNEIEPTLRESNEIHKYKGYVSKLRNHPDYNNRSVIEQSKNELCLIRIRKIILEEKSMIDDHFLNQNNNKNSYYSSHDTINSLKSLIKKIYNVIDNLNLPKLKITMENKFNPLLKSVTQKLYNRDMDGALIVSKQIYYLLMSI